MKPRRSILCLLVILHGPRADAAGNPSGEFFEKHCYECHDTETKKGGLDLTALKPEFATREGIDVWTKVHDRMANGEMPPAKKKRPPVDDLALATSWLDNELMAADARRLAAEGRAAVRRLTRVEYVNTLCDLLALPRLKIIEMLPADGTRHGYDKVSEALDLSHVQLAKYLEASDFALDLAVATHMAPPPVFKRRIYPASGNNFRKMVGTGNAVLLRKVGDSYEPDPIWPVPGQLTGQAYMDSYEASAKAGVPASHSAVGLFHPNDNYLQTSCRLAPLYSGNYRLRISLWSFMWNAGTVEPSPRTEVGLLHIGPRTLGYFDAPSLSPLVSEVTAWIDPGEEVFYDDASIYAHNMQVRQRKGGGAAYVGPGIATDWLEVEGPIFEQWPPESHRRLFGDLPIKPFDAGGGARPPHRVAPREMVAYGLPKLSDLPPAEVSPPLCSVTSAQPLKDATSLLSRFLPRAFRRPVPGKEVQHYDLASAGEPGVAGAFRQGIGGHGK